MAKTLRKLIADDRGGVAVFGAMVALTAIGAGAIAVDVGRMTVLRSQMQNAADARAMAAAVQLDGRDGARTRATTVAQSIMSHGSAIPEDKKEIKVASVQFYSQYAPAKVAATSDQDAVLVEVVLESRQVDFLFEPVLDMLTGADGDSTALTTYAVAGPDPYICDAPPLMICDYGDKGGGVHDWADDLRNENHAGRQVRLKEHGASGTWVPGNFGLLSLPDGSSGASDLEAALAGFVVEDCYKLDVTTATGSKTEKIVEAINSRFDITGNSWPHPAPDVITFPRDAELIASSTEKLGSGDWDLAGYWTAKHGGSVPSELADATRYQVYLYELGMSFARNGKQTLYPLPGDGTLPAGYDLVEPSSGSIPVAASPANEHDPNYDGEPRPTNPTAYGDVAKDYSRRLVTVVQLQCTSLDVKGKHEYPTQANYLEIFITEYMQDPPNADLYGEVVRSLSPTNNPEFHANVKLIR
ncbi:MAG: Tad domain-containing protein [Rhodospirillales bacterium]|nr:Tad domain-containing protein [Rhodospirillales bacterium]